MTDPVERVRGLLREAGAVGEGAAQVALIEEAVRVADLHNEGEAAYEARKLMMRAARRASRDDLAAVACAWCLGWQDRRADRPRDIALLGEYYSILFGMSNLPQVTREQASPAWSPTSPPG